MSPGPTHDERDPRSGDSILDTIGQRVRRSVRVSLEGDAAGDEAALGDEARAYQEQLRDADRGKYRVLGEIARGGMGVVLRGHDCELGRDVAMKVVHGDLADRPEVIDRFVEEAQVGGQLQHPGIVPVYELGLTKDQRPFFTMKLVKGRTLATMLAARESVDEERVQFLSIFEAVCQTLAYAHSKHVIHRDLKPANVMVGSFGEVQVVDWGLSKVLHAEEEEPSPAESQTVIATVRSDPDSGSGSLVGNVLGTPAYMAPEQAQGNVAQLDERTDVFALGAILCELLTGKPPYVAGEGETLVQLAAQAKLEDAHARIAAARASEELKRLCTACLMPAREARPRSAEELARAVRAHLAGLESAAHEAQLAAAEERVRAERSRRRLQLTLGALAVVVLAGAGWRWVEGKREARLAELARGFEEVRSQVAEQEREGRFELAVETARNGLRMVRTGGETPELVRRADELVVAAEAARSADRERVATATRERDLLTFLTDVVARQVETGLTVTDEELAGQYEAAFRAYGLELFAPDLEDRLAPLRDTELGARIALGFDGWGRLLRRMRGVEPERIDLVTGIGLDLDPDPARTAARLALLEEDAGQLRELAHGLDPQTTAPETLVLLASSLRELGERDLSRSLLTRGADLHPESFLLNFGAGRALFDAERRRCIDYLRAAIALRPDLPELYEQLADAYRFVGDYVMSVHSLERLLVIAPDHSWNARQLGLDRIMIGDVEAATRWFELDRDQRGSDPFAESFLRSVEVTEGRLPLEDYLAWAEGLRAEHPSMTISMAFLLCGDGDLREHRDPARARALLEEYLPEGLPAYPYWKALARACLLFGDGPATVAAISRAQAIATPQSLHDDAEVSLYKAGGYRLSGDDERADLWLSRAREARDELITGFEDEWAQSSLLEDFSLVEPIARGG